jgi:Putative Ig domain
LGQLKSKLRTGALLITTEALPSATVDKTYHAPLRVTGGQPPFQWTLGSGKVPGLRLSKTTGILSGRPKAPGPFVLFVKLRDAKDKSTTAFIKLNVLPQSIERNPSPSVRFLDPEIPEKDDGPILTLRDRQTVMLVNMVPRGMSGETGQDSEPFLAVHPNGKLMVGVAYTQFERGIMPHYLSTDGGWTWRLRKLIPFNAEYSSQTYAFSGEGNKLFGAVARLGRDQDMRLYVLQSEDPSRSKLMSEMYSASGMTDQPFLQAVFLDNSRIYVGGNNFNHSPRTATMTVSTDGGATFRELVLESRSTAEQDGPAIRPSISKDGTVYSAFMRWRSTAGSFTEDNLRIKGDIVICREDEASGLDPTFAALCDPSDSKPGRIIAANRNLPFSREGKLGQQRLGGDLSVAADPNQSATVYVAWADLSHGKVTLHLRRSTDRGETWSDDLLSVASAVNPAIAVSDDGVLGCLYQQHINENWETHFRKSTKGDGKWSDIILVRAPSRKPVVVFQPYIGRTHLTSVGSHFYGVFSASNDPDPEHFPEGVRFQRRHRVGRLLSVDGRTPVAISIDPYFFDIPSKP